MAMKFGEGLRTESKQTPVLIVGAGPVGLSMACFLRRYGMVCRIVDQKPSPTPEPESRALGLQARTLEVFEALGLVDSLLEDGRSVFGAVAYQGRRPRFRLDFATIADATAYPFLLAIPPGRTERRLLERLEALGGQVDWQTQLTGLRHQDAEVSVTLTDPDGQSREERVSWLIGCDGAHSVVRHALGLNFPGTVYSELFLLADLQISPGFSEDYAHVMLMPDGTLPMIPLPEPGRWRLIETTGDLQTDEEDAVIRRFNALLRTHAPKPVTVSDPNWISNFHIHRRVVDRLQVGRCFVLGDAAHIHSPVGGQGLNTGVQDAANLAWKLALVVHGQAASPLLETTDIERLPVAKALLANTERPAWP